MSNPRLSGQTMTRSFITNDNVSPHIKSRLDMSTKLLSLTTKRSNHNILVREFELITWRGGAAWAGDSHTDHQNRRHWHRTSMSFFCLKILRRIFSRPLPNSSPLVTIQINDTPKCANSNCSVEKKAWMSSLIT